MNTPETSPSTLKRRCECPYAPEAKRQLFRQDEDEDEDDAKNLMNLNFDAQDIDEKMADLIYLIRMQIAVLKKLTKTSKVRMNLRILLNNVQNLKDLYQWNRAWSIQKLFSVEMINNFDEKERKIIAVFEKFNKEFYESSKYAMPLTDN